MLMFRSLFSFMLVLATVPAVYAQHRDIPPTDKFVVDGLVKKKLMLTPADLMHYARHHVPEARITNKKGELKETIKDLQGVLLTDVLDSAGIVAEKEKVYSEIYIVLTASDGYTNVYSWNELFNNRTGAEVYIVTGIGGKSPGEVPGRILVANLADKVSGRRHLKSLAHIEVRSVEK